MAKTARFTAPMQVVEEESMRAAVVEIADAEGVSQAAVFRSMHYHSLAWRQQLSKDILAGKAPRPKE